MQGKADTLLVGRYGVNSSRIGLELRDSEKTYLSNENEDSHCELKYENEDCELKTTVSVIVFVLFFIFIQASVEG